jgi:hypothetical protein
MLLGIHMAMCANCVFFQNQITGLKRLFGMYTEPIDELPSPYTAFLSDEAQERMKSLLREENR